MPLVVVDYNFVPIALGTRHEIIHLNVPNPGTLKHAITLGGRIMKLEVLFPGDTALGKESLAVHDGRYRVTTGVIIEVRRDGHGQATIISHVRGLGQMETPRLTGIAVVIVSGIQVTRKGRGTDRCERGSGATTAR
eukprot:scaffold3079_cov174-Amphora_coffeaeformis.AAC.15